MTSCTQAPSSSHPYQSSVSWVMVAVGRSLGNVLQSASPVFRLCGVQGPRLATVEALCQVMCVPEVEVANLRTLDADNAEEVPRRHLECLDIPRRHRELGNFGQLGARPV